MLYTLLGILLICTIGMASSSKSSDAARAKRVRLNDLKRGGHVTGRALEQVLTNVKEDGIPDHFSARTQARARKAEASRDTPYGSLVQDFVLPTEREHGDKVAIIRPPSFAERGPVSHTALEAKTI